MGIDRYRVIRKFRCCGEIMVVVKMENATHVMAESEWKQVYGALHPERWKYNIKNLDNIKTA